MLSVDHTQDGFGLRQIDPTGKECAKREFARLGEPRTAAANGFQHGLQQPRRTKRVQLGDRLTRVAAIGRPKEQVARQLAWLILVDRDGKLPGHSGWAPNAIERAAIRRRETSGNDFERRRPADPDDAAGRSAGCGGNRGDRIVDVVRHVERFPVDAKQPVAETWRAALDRKRFSTRRR